MNLYEHIFISVVLTQIYFLMATHKGDQRYHLSHPRVGMSDLHHHWETWGCNLKSKRTKEQKSSVSSKEISVNTCFMNQQGRNYVFK